MRTKIPRFRPGALRPATLLPVALSLAAVSRIPASPAAAEPLGVLGVPARIFYEEKRLGGPFYEAGNPDVEGRLVEQSEESLVIVRKDTGERVEVPLASVARLDISRSRSGRPLLGALLGFGAGAVIGGAVPVEDSQELFGDIDEGFTRAEHIIVGALIGTAAGGVVGSAWRSENWEEVPLHDLHLGLAPSIRRNGDLALELQLAFR